MFGVIVDNVLWATFAKRKHAKRFADVYGGTIEDGAQMFGAYHTIRRANVFVGRIRMIGAAQNWIAEHGGEIS